MSKKWSGLLLRSSFPILAARARHLFSVAPMPAFSVASRPSNSSDIVRTPTSESVALPVGRLLSAPGSKWCDQTPPPALLLNVASAAIPLDQWRKRPDPPWGPGRRVGTCHNALLHGVKPQTRHDSIVPIVANGPLVGEHERIVGKLNGAILMTRLHLTHRGAETAAISLGALVGSSQNEELGCTGR